MYETAKKILRIGELAVHLHKWYRQQAQTVMPDAAGKMAPGLGGFLYQQDEGRDRIFPLDSVLKEQFERALGEDLGQVRIHLGPYATELTHNANAQAVTVGSDIFFAPNTYFPETADGQALLAHELQHFIQNKKQQRMVYYEDIEQLESEAEHIEAGMQTLALHNVTDVARPPLGPGPVPLPYPNLGNSHDRPEFSEALAKSGTGAKTDTIENFLGRQAKPVYELQLPGGKKHRLTPAEYRKLQDLVVSELKGYVSEKSQELSEAEFESWLLHFYQFVKK
jgi:hypothetical protein